MTSRPPIYRIFAAVLAVVLLFMNVFGNNSVPDIYAKGSADSYTQEEAGTPDPEPDAAEEKNASGDKDVNKADQSDGLTSGVEKVIKEAAKNASSKEEPEDTGRSSDAPKADKEASSDKKNAGNAEDAKGEPASDNTEKTEKEPASDGQVVPEKEAASDSADNSKNDSSDDSRENTKDDPAAAGTDAAVTETPAAAGSVIPAQTTAAVEEPETKEKSADEETSAPAQKSPEDEASDTDKPSAKEPAPAESSAVEDPSKSETTASAAESTAAPDTTAAATTASAEETTPSFPAMSFRGETSELIVDASVSGGVFPAGTEMKVRRVSKQKAMEAGEDVLSEGCEVVDAIAADITFHDTDGKELQPEDGRSVHVTLTAKRPIEGDVHYAASETDDEPLAEASSVKASFDAEHFTVYGIVGGKYEDSDVVHHVRRKYEFYAGDPETSRSKWKKVAEQIVRNGEKLKKPADPSGTTRHPFEGWYLLDGSSYAETPLFPSGSSEITVTIDPATLTKEENSGKKAGDDISETVKVYAKYSSSYRVTLYTDSDKKTVYETFTAKDGSNVSLPKWSAIDKSAILLDSHHSFVGWKHAGDSDDKVLNDYRVTVNGKDIELVPVIASAFKVEFDYNPTGLPITNPGIPSQFVFPGDKAAEPAQLKTGDTLDGYKLAGWYTKVSQSGNGALTFNEADKWDFNTPLDRSMMLHAKWVTDKADYTVIIMQEDKNCIDGAETYSEWITSGTNAFSGTTGQPVDTSAVLLFVNSHRDNTNDGSSMNSTWHFHLSGTGTDTGNEPHKAIEVEHNGVVTAKYNANGTPLGEEGQISGDGNTVVRVYMNRNEYTLRVLYKSPYAEENTVTTWRNGQGGPKFNTSSDITLPDGAPEDLSNEVYRIRFRENMYSTIFLKSSALQALNSWKFLRYYGPGNSTSGNQTRIDFTNSTLNLIPSSQLEDGADIYIMVEYVPDQFVHPFHFTYYHPNGTKNEEKSFITEISYAKKPHAHTYHIGKIEHGYQLTKITTGEKTYTAPTDNNSYKFEYDENENAKPMVLYHYPVPYSITFVPNDSVNPAFKAVNTAWTKNGLEPNNFYVNDDYSYVIDDKNGAGIDRYKTGYREIQNGVLKEFAGWYDNPDFTGEAFDFTGKTMPADNFVFYAKWVPVECTVVFHKNNDEDDEKQTVTVGKKAVKINNPEFEGHLFGGWFLDENFSTEYDFNTVLDEAKVAELADKEDTIHLYAEWHLPVSYTIVYDAAGGSLSDHLKKQLSELPEETAGNITLTGESMMDNKTYRQNASVPVNGTAEKDGYVFMGWQLGGSTLTGGDVFTANAKLDKADGKEDHIIILKAVFASEEQKADVTYHANYPGGGSDHKVTLKYYVGVNESFAVLEPDDAALGFHKTYKAPDGRSYKFLGWTVDKNASKIGFDVSADHEYFKPGETAAAASDNNNLYAVWEVIPEDPPAGDTHPKTEVIVKKTWIDDDNAFGDRPESVKVKLVKKDSDGTSDTGKTAVLNEKNSWKHTFYDLPEHDSHGKAIEYSVKETDLPAKYTIFYTTRTDEKDNIECLVVNTHEGMEEEEGKKALHVQKIWDDDDNAAGQRPASVSVTLYANGKKSQTAVLNAKNNWFHTFHGLPIEDGGKTVSYTVKENGVPSGYKVEYSHEDLKDGSTGWMITNLKETEYTRVIAQKVWDDDGKAASLRPGSITVELYADDVYEAKAVLNQANEWHHTFGSLPKYKNGHEIKYTVLERSVPKGYTVSYAKWKDAQGNTIDVVINSTGYEEEEGKTSLMVQKIWDDENQTDIEHPDSIEVILRANGAEIDRVTLNEDNTWFHAFHGLNVQDAKGKAVKYDVVEVVPDGFEAQYMSDTDSDGHTVWVITNVPGDSSNEPEPMKKDSNERDVPKTGDDFHLRRWLTVLAGSGVLLIVLIALIRKSRKK